MPRVQSTRAIFPTIFPLPECPLACEAWNQLPQLTNLATVYVYVNCACADCAYSFMYFYRAYTGIYMCMSLWIHTYTHIYIYIHIFIYIYIFINAHIWFVLTMFDGHSEFSNILQRTIVTRVMQCSQCVNAPQPTCCPPRVPPYIPLDPALECLTCLRVLVHHAALDSKTMYMYQTAASSLPSGKVHSKKPSRPNESAYIPATVLVHGPLQVMH